MDENSPQINETLHMRDIAHYRIIRKLGSGGMSIVYEAFDERLKRAVALKMLMPNLSESQQYRERFFREAQAVARLAHPNIVQIFDVCPQNNPNSHLYLVTELLLGRTLKELAQELDMIHLPELGAMIIWQVLAALEHAHQKGIIHRDIKPENIMVCNNGQIKLMDFGIASISGEDGLTDSGTLLGSFAHVSPEIIKGHGATVATDIFSLSTVFYWLVSGKLPFQKENVPALLKAIVDTAEARITEISPSISDILAEVIAVGMKKDPKKRFASAAEMSLAIERALEAFGMTIDSNRLARVLQPSQDELPEFIQNMTKCLSTKLEQYTLSHDETSAMAVNVRLLNLADSNSLQAPSITAPAKTSKQKLKPYLWLVPVAVVVLVVIGVFFPRAKEATVEPIATHQEALLIAEPTPIPTKEPPAIKDEPQRKPETAPLASLEISIWPFANVLLDGKLVAEDSKRLTLEVQPGVHRLLFTHAYAASVEKIVDLSPGLGKRIDVKLVQSKPSLLVVRANVDGDVAVGRSYRGSSHKTASEPIVIAIPDKTHALNHEVIVTREGYIPYVANVAFVAGKTILLNVTLEPATEASRH